MSVLIKGMEMPVIELEWTIRHGADGKWYAIDTNAETTDGEWHEIVPVPPHGDLIERDAAYDKIAEREDHIDYCTECEHIRLVRGVPYCGISGKLLHPMMYTPIEGGGSGPARNCEKRRNT